VLADGSAGAGDALLHCPVVGRGRRQVGEAPMPEGQDVLGRQASAAAIVRRWRCTWCW
jgi:hypothetical protein